MELNNLPKFITRRRKRVGRGIGSGLGKTAGRGMKGQKARGKIKADTVGGGLTLYKKLPYKRGWSRNGGNPARSLKPVLIKTSKLNNLKAGTVVNLQTLVDNQLITEKAAQKRGIKVLSDQPLTVALQIEFPVSKTVLKQLEKAGGKIVAKS